MSRKYSISPDGSYYIYMVPDEDYDVTESQEWDGLYKVIFDYDAVGHLVGVELLAGS